jgi:hypothetical protein
MLGHMDIGREGGEMEARLGVEPVVGVRFSPSSAVVL